MPSWVSSWLFWSSIGAAGTLGVGFLAAAVEDLMHGAVGQTPLSLGFGGIGLCILAFGLWLRGAADAEV